MPTTAANFTESQLRGLRDRDRRNTAWHEAGHAIVAHHFGLDWNAYLRKNEDFSNPIEECYWAGQTRFHAAAPRYGRTPPFRTCAISMAGAIAEMHAPGEVDLGGPIDEVIADLWFLGVENGFSDTDLEGIACHRQKNRAFRVAVQVLGQHLDQLEALAHHLVQDDYCSRYMFETEVL